MLLSIFYILLMPTWQELPTFFKVCLVEKLDYKSRCHLRLCSVAEKILVDCCPITFKTVKFENLETPSKLQTIPIPKCIQKNLEFNFSINEFYDFYPNTVSLILSSFPQFLKIFESQFSLIEQLVFKGFRDKKSQTLFLKQLKQEIHAKRENWDFSNFTLKIWSLNWNFDGVVGEEILEFLKLLDVSTLKKLCITEYIPERIFKKLISSDHWRGLKRVMLIKEMDILFHNFDLLERFDIKIKILAPKDVWKVVKPFLFKDRPRMSGFTIFHSNRIIVKEVFRHTIIPMHNNPVDGVWGACRHTQRFPMNSRENTFVLIILDDWVCGFVGLKDNIDQEYLRFMNDFF